MKRMCFAAVVALTCAGWAVQAVAQTAISTDGNVEALGFIGDGSQVTDVDAQLLDGMDSSDFAQEVDLMSTEAMLVALQAQVDALGTARVPSAMVNHNPWLITRPPPGGNSTAGSKSSSRSREAENERFGTCEI